MTTTNHAELLRQVQVTIGDGFYAQSAVCIAAAAHLDQLEAQLPLVQDALDGERAGKMELAKLLHCADEPRWKWITLEVSRMKAELEQLRQAATQQGAENTPPAVDATGLPKDVMRALCDARDVAMRNTVAARVPECGDFGAIAQNLDWAINELKRHGSEPESVNEALEGEQP